MRITVPLGCNCHPAWWLRKLGYRRQSLPFDWLLSKPHLGLGYALDVYHDDFTGWLDDLSVNARGHPVSARYPQTELFHHHDLLATDPSVRSMERRRLEQRARDFVALVRNEDVNFLYCYALRGRQPTSDERGQFEASVDRLLATWRRSTLHVYFLTDAPGMPQSNMLVGRPRLVEHLYFRDQSIDKNWGTEPAFLRGIAAPSELTAPVTDK